MQRFSIPCQVKHWIWNKICQSGNSVKCGIWDAYALMMTEIVEKLQWNIVGYCIIIVFSNPHEFPKWEHFTSGKSEMRRTEKTHSWPPSQSSETPLDSFSIKAELHAGLKDRELLNTMWTVFQMLHCAVIQMAQKQGRHSCPQPHAWPSFCLEECPEKINPFFLLFRASPLFEI